MVEKNNYDLPFPTRLRQLLSETGASQQAVADFVGVSRQALVQWRDGKTVPDLYNFQRLAEFFGVPYEFLLGETACRVRDNLALCDALGLSDAAVETLLQLREPDAGVPLSEAASRFIGHSSFPEFLRLLQKSLSANGSESGQGVPLDAHELSEYYRYRAHEVLRTILRTFGPETDNEI